MKRSKKRRSRSTVDESDIVFLVLMTTLALAQSLAWHGF